MEQVSRYLFEGKSFFPPQETKDTGNGIFLWRGYFQSLRPGIGRMLVNVDVSYRMMYRPGRLIDLCLEFLGEQDQGPNALVPHMGLTELSRVRLRRFLQGIEVAVTAGGSLWQARAPRPIRNISRQGAKDLFTSYNGTTTTITDYYQTVYNLKLQFPDLLCVKVRLINAY